MRKHLLALYVLGVCSIALSVFSVQWFHQRVTILEQRRIAPINGQAAGPWGLLSQQEVDAITAAVKDHSEHITIYCIADCNGMALDFDNAFESAHWTSEIERPAIDINTGINTTAHWLADAINRATNNRLRVGVIPGTKLALVISKKVK